MSEVKMAHNTLFNFIKLYIVPQTISFPNCEPAVADENKKGVPYFRFELKIANSISFTDGEHTHRLVSHHISVYESEKTYDPSLSQYHYTAYFEDEEGFRYQLHVYFDDADRLTQEPIFARESKNEKTEVINCNRLNEGFVELARTNIEPVIGEIRTRLNNKIQALESSYRDLEKQASELSTNLATNYPDYLKKLGRIQSTLTNLIPLVKHDHYIKVLMLINQLKKSVEKFSPKPTTKTLVKATTQPIPSAKKSSTNLGIHSTFNQKNRRARSSKTTLNLVEKLEHLESCFEDFDNKPESTQVKVIGEVYADINALLLQLEIESRTPSVTNLTRLKKLHVDIINKGTALLNTLIENHYYTMAGELKAFHYLLTVERLCHALETRNHNLIDFILTHGDLTLSNQPLRIKHKVYLSAVHYCYIKDNEKEPQVSCLAALIKHGAYVFISGEDGLPIAYSILSDKNHPLRSAFTLSNPRHTVESASFYKQLLAKLDYYLRETELDETQQAKIVSAMGDYLEKIATLRGFNRPAEPAKSNLPRHLDTQLSSLGFLFFSLANMPNSSRIYEKIAERFEF